MVWGVDGACGRCVPGAVRSGSCVGMFSGSRRTSMIIPNLAHNIVTHLKLSLWIHDAVVRVGSACAFFESFPAGSTP